MRAGFGRPSGSGAHAYPSSAGVSFPQPPQPGPLPSNYSSSTLYSGTASATQCSPSMSSPNNAASALRPQGKALRPRPPHRHYLSVIAYRTLACFASAIACPPSHTTPPSSHIRPSRTTCRAICARRTASPAYARGICASASRLPYYRAQEQTELEGKRRTRGVMRVRVRGGRHKHKPKQRWPSPRRRCSPAHSGTDTDANIDPAPTPTAPLTNGLPYAMSHREWEYGTELGDAWAGP
ncbi:hypothetical protein B0H12DRAFT_1238899 [Mycena haematopus]|nr:hypothetical protein B0H12DRAFT_1238899 [Mycena haematopus]